MDDSLPLTIFALMFSLIDMINIFAVFKGLELGPLIGMAIAVNPSILVASVGSSALVFASLSASVLYSPVPSQIYVTGMILSTLSISFWLAILNLFMQSSMLWSMELYLGLFLFSLYVIYDTQILIKKAEEGSKLYLRHCLELYIDAVARRMRRNRKRNEGTKSKCNI